MKKKSLYENYPWQTIVISISHQLAIYIIAGIIIFDFNLSLFFLYLFYLIVLEMTFYPRACVYCYYYGKWCFMGKGKVAALLFEKRNPQKFCERQADFKNMIPELLIVIVPIILGIVLLIQSFSWFISVLIILDIFLMTRGNSYVRGKLACPHCKQGQICCPVNKMFAEKVKSG